MNVSPTLYAERLRHVSPALYKAAAQAWIDKEYPRHLFIETTATCNLRCNYCPRERINQHMDFNLLGEIVKEATRFGSRSFSLHLFGEPLLYPKWYEAVQLIKGANRRHTVILTTNGTLLNQQVNRVISSGLDKVIWTWRPEAQFTQETKEKLKAWGKFQVRLIEEITPPEALMEWSDWYPQERKRLHNYGGNIDTSKWAKPGTAGPKDRWPCYHLWTAPAVAWNGDILLCCNDPFHREVIAHFPETSVAMAWNSDRLAGIRADHLGGNFRGICAGCDVWKTYPDMFFWWQKRVPAMIEPVPIQWLPGVPT